jgi:hypothetical protein
MFSNAWFPWIPLLRSISRHSAEFSKDFNKEGNSLVEKNEKNDTSIVSFSRTNPRAAPSSVNGLFDIAHRTKGGKFREMTRPRKVSGFPPDIGIAYRSSGVRRFIIEFICDRSWKHDLGVEVSAFAARDKNLGRSSWKSGNSKTPGYAFSRDK